MDDHEEPVQEAADEAEATADRLERQASEVDEHVEEARSDWRRKQQDPGVPGAQSPDREPGDAGGEVAGDWEDEGQAAQDAGQ